MSESKSSENVTPKTPPKKLKRLCFYRKEWEAEFQWLTAEEGSSSKGVARAFCKICSKSFQVGYAGKSDVKRHEMGNEHKKMSATVKQNQSISLFFKKTNTLSSSEEKVVIAEVCSVFHTVKHAHSYNSLNCTSQISSIIFDDSKIAKDMTLGRTKASCIAFNVLGPASLETHLEELLKGIFYSISTDASNHGSLKMFPVVIRYYIPSEGIRVCLLDFFKDADESANAVFLNLKTKIEGFGLNLNNVSSYSADNASVNFGRHHSIYQLLLQENPKILPSGCPAHMVNNSIKHGLEKCKFDLENFVLKIYSHFSSQAKRVKVLEDFFEFVELEYKPILRHVPTRWLSLYPAVERLAKIFPAIKSYFLSLDENCPLIIKSFISDESVGSQNLITECYLAFFHNTLKMFFDTEQQLEKRDLLCFEMFKIIDQLRLKLEQRIEDEFLGFLCTNMLKNLPNTCQQDIKLTCIKFYRDTLSYINMKFDFSVNNILSKLHIFSLSEPIHFKNLSELVEQLKLNEFIDMDQLYEEFCQIKATLQVAYSTNISTLEKWKLIFTENPNLNNLLKVVQFVFSIFGSNADAERIFSICAALWTEVRNKLTIEHAKAELQIKINFTQDCKEFYSFVKHNRSLLQAAKSNKKYLFKFKTTASET